MTWSRLDVTRNSKLLHVTVLMTVESVDNILYQELLDLVTSDI